MNVEVLEDHMVAGKAHFDEKKWKESVDFYDLALAAYNKATKYSGGYAEYAKAQIKHVDKQRTKAWRKWKGIE